MQKVRKAVLPVAGFGTRFLPATKVQPKEMLPLIDKPTIQYIVEEMVASGIEQIILVTSGDKRAIEDHFDHNQNLEKHLEESGKLELLEQIKKISEMAEFVYVRQKGPYGNGTPIKNVRKIIGDEPFVCAFGDDLVKSEVPLAKQLIDVYSKYNGMVVAAQRIPQEDVSKYGVLDIEKIKDNVFQVNDLVEKPLVKDAPSNMVVTGRYILTPDIFDALDRTELGKGGELYLTDAIDLLLNDGKKLYACEFEGKYYDCGNKIEFVKAIIDFSLERPEMSAEINKHLRKIIS
ncbi:MAG: UTP--glucose-1-phosphate uridylyltransferase GalU [Patescibacteria group bacterium]